MRIMTSGAATKPTPRVDRTIILPNGQEAYEVICKFFPYTGWYLTYRLCTALFY